MFLDLGPGWLLVVGLRFGEQKAASWKIRMIPRVKARPRQREPMIEFRGKVERKRRADRRRQRRKLEGEGLTGASVP